MAGADTSAYYDGPDLRDPVFAALEAAGRSGPLDADDLAGLAELRATLEACGFEAVAWNEGADLQSSIQAAAGDHERMATGLEGIDLSLVMPDVGSRMAGLARNVGEQRIALVQAVMGRP